MIVGVDIGGTFTDLVLSDEGQLKIHKLPSTPHNPAEGMLAGLNAITNGRLADLERVAHGSTVATNAILERKGAKTAFITTQGFRDVLFIGRQDRPVLYALQPQLPPPLIPRELCYEVPERLDFSGEVLTELDLMALDKVLDEIAWQEVDSIAVCFLYSYVNPSHEQKVRDRIVKRGLLEEWQVALSSEVLPEFREYERASTVALESYVRPVMGRYITQLETELHKSHKKMNLSVMKSDGGVIGAKRVRQQAIQTALSGPAAGVIGAFHVAKMAGFDNIITLDMGGTSTDVAVCLGEPVRRPQSEIDGLPLRIRLLDIETIGAGGGSIARIDAGGVLQVGPESAGANPGPIIYGWGGRQVTVSDANALLGILDADYFLGGGMSLDVESAQAAIEDLAHQAGMSPQAIAQGVIDVANANIDRALRRVSVTRGYDPRNFTLVPFGGAGAMHACAIAEQLEMPRVLIPRYPGVLCALGLLVSDVVLEYSQSILKPVTDDLSDELLVLIEDILIVARDDLKSEGVPRADRHYLTSLDVRYQGQAYELNIPVSATMDIRDQFHEEHRLTYGHSMKEHTVEVVNLRVQAVGTVERPDIVAEVIDENAKASTAFLDKKETVTGATFRLYQRDNLQPGASFEGPALVFQLDSTVFVAAGWTVRVDGYRNLILEKI